MKSVCYALIACCLPLAALAQERIPDLSLPIEQSQENHDEPTIEAPQPVETTELPPVAPPPDSTAEQEEAPPPMPTERFMDRFCSPDFEPVKTAKPVLAQLQECAQAQRIRACATFNRLPGEVQSALDGIIGCAYASANREEGAPAPVCDGNEQQRLRLAKKYWRDQEVVQALLFLPENVLETGHGCAKAQ